MNERTRTSPFFGTSNYDAWIAKYFMGDKASYDIETITGEEKMKRYYTTMSPDSAKHILLETEEQAMNEAKERVEEDGRPRYVCKVIAKIEQVLTPTKTTRFE